MLFQGLLMFLKANSNGIAQKNVTADLGEWSFIITLNKILRWEQHFESHSFYFWGKKPKPPFLQNRGITSNSRKTISCNGFQC